MSTLTLIQKHPDKVFDLLDDIDFKYITEFKLAGRNLGEVYQANITINSGYPKFDVLIS